MRVWGQWFEHGQFYGVMFDKDWLYRFNHWKKAEWHGPNNELIKRDQMKFYIQLTF